MYSSREELISKETEYKLLEHGLSLELMVSCTLENDSYKEFTNPFYDSIANIHLLADQIKNDARTFNKYFRRHLKENHHSDLRNVIWVAVYRHKDINKHGWSLKAGGVDVESRGELIGFAYVLKDKIRKTRSVKYINSKLRNNIEAGLVKSVDRYSAWLKNDVYGFVLKDGFGVKYWKEQHAVFNVDGSMDDRIAKSIHWAKKGLPRKPACNPRQMVINHIYNPIVVSYKELPEDEIEYSAAAHLNKEMRKNLGISLNLFNLKYNHEKKEFSAEIILCDYFNWSSNKWASENLKEIEGTCIADDKQEWHRVFGHYLINAMISQVKGFNLVSIGGYEESCRYRRKNRFKDNKKYLRA